MLAKRIIPCLDIRDGQTVKGINFMGLRQVGDPVELGAKYASEGADELVYLDISASEEGRRTFTELVARIAARIDIPFTVGGGISSVDDACRLLDAGADKITLNSAAVANPALIDAIAAKYGSQCVVAAIDARTVDGRWVVTTHGGKRPTERELFVWAREAADRGAGEILFTSMDHDGTKNGYPCDTFARLAELPVPIIASGGAGSVGHIAEVLTRGRADAALAAMGLEDARRTPLRRLTPAQRRRLSIAREIVRAPEVFYIEEPLAGQDAEGCRRILEWMDGVPSTGRRCIAATASTRTVYLLPGERYHLDGNGLERLEAAEESAAQGAAVEKIPAKAGETLLLFNPSDIDFAESASGRTALSVRGEEYACALTLEELSARLERYGFFRCHRSYLVNMQKVQEVVRWTRNSYALRLENGPESGVPLSKGRIDAMRRQYRF